MTMTKASFSTTALAAIAALPRDTSLPTVSPDAPRAPSCLCPPTPALDTEDSDNHNNSIDDGDSTSASSGNVSYPADIHCNYDRNCDKTSFIAVDVDPALEFVQANRPVSEVIPSHSTDKLHAILCADSRCANVVQHALSLEHLVHPLSFDNPRHRSHPTDHALQQH